MVVEKLEQILGELVDSGRLSKSMLPKEATKDGLFSVFITQEAINKRSDDVGSPIYYDRSLAVEIEIAVANAEQTNRFLVHDLSVLVEEAIAGAGDDLGGIVDSHELLGFSLEHSNDTSQTQIGSLTYQVDYTTLATDVQMDTF